MIEGRVAEEIFVVRSPGEWTITRVPARDPEPASIEDVLSHLDRRPSAAELGAVWSGPGLTPRVPADLSDIDQVEPVWMWVGRAVAEGVVVEDPGGGAVILDREDLRLLDRVSGRIAVRALLEVPDDDSTRARLADLIAAGRLLKAEPAESGTEVAPDDAVTGTDEAPEPPTAPGGGAEGFDSGELAPSHEATDVPTVADPVGMPGRGVRPLIDELRGRLLTAWRLSSKLRPLREAVARAGRR